MVEPTKFMSSVPGIASGNRPTETSSTRRVKEEQPTSAVPRDEVHISEEAVSRKAEETASRTRDLLASDSDQTLGLAPGFDENT